MRVTITGFEPFNAFERNPSWDVAQGMAEALRALLAPGAIEVNMERLPVTFSCAREWADERCMRDGDPTCDWIIHMGLASSRAHLSLETTARNLAALTPDNEARCAPHAPCLEPGGPEALESRLPLARWAQLIAQEQDAVEVALTRDAGAYVCNAIFYHSLRVAPSRRVVFVHVPWQTPEASRARGAALARALSRLTRAGADI